ncbi:MAG: MOSC N-terminal beta barrel domain-containing protein [Thermosynechococcaceae cyanobacterium MS004]|nr:MOSC N-terminal beta barrel domain-containing protein [Thermosynechococcaceae cyanobacterium MS004]
MVSTPSLTRIEIFPIKSLDGVVVDAVHVLPSGALLGDRQYALTDEQGRFVNGKSTPLIHQLRASYSWDSASGESAPTLRVTLWKAGEAAQETFVLSGQCRAPSASESQNPNIQNDEGHKSLNAWLSNFFGKPITLRENSVTGFPDDLKANGPTLVSTATLERVATWFPDLTLTDIRRRFRTNLEISGVPPFWEDRLYGDGTQLSIFQVGSTRFVATNPCQRCVVPTRNSWTGEAYLKFQRRFSENREANLPNWAPRSQFNHFYKLAVNTRLAETTVSEKSPFLLRVGDWVSH